ncbi:MAG: lysophospholipid acyltransferase family protein [Bacillota bacterium]|uniref:lysophospholipid acyltransferase family protein n=1 Tax=Thermanaerosceptrum fracticalcis TaxID=1712410 RepID=UPI00054F2022|nr:lysophospholipid acyltransferase family protein [Thermanaerosceptrum fracticalcis]
MLKSLLYFLGILPYRIRVKIVRFLTKKLIDYYADLKITGLENIPEETVIFVCNHLSNADGIIFRDILAHRHVVFMAGVKLQGEYLTNLVLETIDHISIHPNQPDRKALKEAIEASRGGKDIFIFPEGTRSRTGKMIEGRSGVLLIAKQAGVPLVPVGIWGSEKLLPIQSGKMDQEWFQKAQVNVVFGQPFTLTELDEEKAIESLMKRIARLLPEDYRGIYL